MMKQIWLIICIIKVHGLIKEPSETMDNDISCHSSVSDCVDSRIYIFDFSSNYFTSSDFYEIKYLLKVSIQLWMNGDFPDFEGRGNVTKMCRIDRNVFDWFQECTNPIDCFKIIDKMEYENIIQEAWDNPNLVFNDTHLALDYSNNLTTILTESFAPCFPDTVILFTNRIVDIRKYQNITKICLNECINFSVILFGRNESDATKDLNIYYDYILNPCNMELNLLQKLPDYNCVTNLFGCISNFLSKHCLGTGLDKSPPIPTPISVIKTKVTFYIIFGGIIGGAILILLLSLFFYRRRQQRKGIEKIIKSHQNPENIDEWELTWDKLMIKTEELGSGAFGQVLQGQLLGIQKSENEKFIEKKEEVAIKILQRYTNEMSETKLVNGHKNVIKMIGCITVGDRICLVLEFCPFRDLLQYSKTKQSELVTFQQTADHIKKGFLIFAWQISHGMQYLASEGIIHRDLAARNILINEFKIAKISDFGLCVQINDKHKNSPTNNILHIETGKLPVKWLAIESLKNYEFSLQSDIWSFGIVLYEMFSFGEIPFSEIELSELQGYLEAENRPEKPEICTDEIYEIMLKCWNSSPTLRLSFDELITIFTVFLEHSTENYGYVIKAEINDQKKPEKFIHLEDI